MNLLNFKKNKVITIKPCDKGAGIIILDFEAYITSCNNHLKSEQLQPDGSRKPFYSKVDLPTLDTAKTKILSLLQEALQNGYISKDEFQAMDRSEKTPGRFYELFKVHKQHEPGETPPERPIISGSGSITENISLFVEHYIQKVSIKQCKDLNKIQPTINVQ